MNEHEALTWIAEIFEELVEDIDSESPRDKIPGWDSMGVLSLMAEMDETFGIILTQKDLKNLNGVNDILEVLKKNGKLEKC